MAYVAPSTVSSGNGYTAVAHNIIVNDVIDHETRINLGGMVFLSTQTVSAALNCTFTSIFSATYQNYMWTYHGVIAPSQASGLDCQFGNSGVFSAVSYENQQVQIRDTTVTASRPVATSGILATIGDTKSSAQGYFYGPFLADRTNYQGNGFAGNWQAITTCGGSHNVSTSFNSVKFTPDYVETTRTLTGIFKIYGLTG